MSDDEFSQFFADNHVRLVRFAFFVGADRDAAEDVVVEAFSKCLGPWRGGRVRDLESYVRRAVVNELRSRARRDRLTRLVSGRSRRSGPRVESAESPVADSLLLAAALAALPLGQRTVVALRYLEDLSERDTASAMGVSVGTVKSQAARGLAALRLAIDQEDKDDD